MKFVCTGLVVWPYRYADLHKCEVFKPSPLQADLNGQYRGLVYPPKPDNLNPKPLNTKLFWRLQVKGCRRRLSKMCHRFARTCLPGVSCPASIILVVTVP